MKLRSVEGRSAINPNLLSQRIEEFLSYELSQQSQSTALTERLTDLQDSHMAATLLRYYAGFPRVSFSLWSSLPCHIAQAAADFDTMIQEALVSMLVMGQGHTATIFSGLGLHSALTQAPAATYLGSFGQTKSLVKKILRYDPDREAEMDSLATHGDREDWVSRESIFVSLRQRPLL